MPNLRNGSKGGFEPGLTSLRVRHSTAELPRTCILILFILFLKNTIMFEEYYVVDHFLTIVKFII